MAGDVKGADGALAIRDSESQSDAVADETARVIDPAAERALCRKFDYRLLPVLAIMVSAWPSCRHIPTRRQHH